ncbi:hypothetical protein WKW66_12110 [Vibrio alginolyticus]|uniref:hypothetical protein n=1 Tax=Vibrio alginolyticus TaxID=663 RepID=UPI0027EA9FE7|nr:glycosyltransferase [Vibrio alginolyticus]
MERVLVNATAAREGGAKTILDEYAKHNDCENLVVLSPYRPKGRNLKWVKYETTGIMTIIFSAFFVLYFAKKFNCNKIVSFSNVNTPFFWGDKVTYFHNLLILKSNSIKYCLIRWSIRISRFSQGKFVFQSSDVKEIFESNIFRLKNSAVHWPGISEDIFEIKPKPEKMAIKFDRKLVLVPIMDLNNKNKNFEFLLSFLSEFKGDDVDFLITSEFPADPSFKLNERIKFLGKLGRKEYIENLLLSDAVLVLSEHETVGLPIFESIYLNKPAFVLKRDYILSIMSVFKGINGIYLFDDYKGLTSHLDKLYTYEFERNSNKIFCGDWSF